MRAGSLKHKIEFQKLTTNKNTYGESTKEYTKVCDSFASIEPVKGSESFLSNQKYLAVTHKIRVRYIPGIDSNFRIVFGGRIFEIDSVLNSYERNSQLEILATEVIDG